MPANKGSVGKNISMGNPGKKLLSGTESGTIKTKASKSLSIDKKAAITNSRTNGTRLK